MAANEFIAKFTADGSINEQCDMEHVYSEYSTLANKLSTKDRGTFALNVLCTLRRNLEEVPSWRDKVDSKGILQLSIDCVRETRSMEKADREETLVCVDYIVKHVTRMNSPIPPQLVLKLSLMPFEDAPLLKKHFKTYWNILADRIDFIGKIKPKVDRVKLLPKLSADIITVAVIYDNVPFCLIILSLLVKRINNLYKDDKALLVKTYSTIFENLTKSDLNSFKKLNNKDSMDLYVIFNDCLCYIAANASRGNIKDSLEIAVRSCVTLLGHRPEMVHCFQTFYLNAFCSILTRDSYCSYMETVLNTLINSCETTERLGYTNTMLATYPFLYLFLRLYIEKFYDSFTEVMQEKCLGLILFLMEKLKKTEQLGKCDKCKFRTGLHDALRLSLFIMLFIDEKLNENILPMIYSIIQKQYVILNEMKNRCSNYNNYYLRIQTDVHNMATKLCQITLYKFSLKLFDIYLINYFENGGSDTKNICRALYNKSLCEKYMECYEGALIDALLSQIFAQKDGLSNDKYIRLVVDIKAHFKDKVDSGDVLQLMSVLEACKSVMKNIYYGNLKPFLLNLKFSKLLKQEFCTYAKHWPSVNPIAGVWISLNELSKQKDIPWLKYENKDEILNTLYDVILQTPNVVTTLNNEYFKKIILELLERFENEPANTTDLRVVHATLLFMKADIDLADASEKYNWMIREPMNRDLVKSSRTIPQEHSACLKAIEAVEIWILLIKELNKMKNTSNLALALKMAQLFVYEFIYLYKIAHGLQMAHVCCQIAKHIGDKEAYVTNAGIILYHMSEGSEELTCIITLASRWSTLLMKDQSTMQSAIVFICDAAIFYSKTGSIGKSAALVQVAQARLLTALQKHPDINMKLAEGKVLEAQTLLYQESGPTILTAIMNELKHYCSVYNDECGYLPWRTMYVRLGVCICSCSVRVCACTRALGAWSRGRRTCARTLSRASAHARAILLAVTTNTAPDIDGAQTKIDCHLKNILGLFHPTYEIQSNVNTTETNIKNVMFPKQDVETMLQTPVFKKTETRPSIKVTVPEFKTPAFFKHGPKCDCYACENPYCIILAAQMCGLQASMYFRAKDFDIAKKYYEGTLKCFGYINDKLKSIFKKLLDSNFDRFLIDSYESLMAREFGKIKIDVLIEAAFFELSHKNNTAADDYVVLIREIVQEIGGVDLYVRNEILKLMTTSAQLRKVVKLPDMDVLVIESDSLKLSPYVEPPSTPVNKVPYPQVVKILVNDEEVPELMPKGSKLDFKLENLDDKKVKDTRKKPLSKIPVPVKSKPVKTRIEKVPIIDNRPSSSKPKIIVTQQSIETTPIYKMGNELFTPSVTPEQFFTPLTSVKTHSKKSDSEELESKFSTPMDMENSTLKRAPRTDVASKSRSNLKAVKALQRATSPGPLERECNVMTRSRRCRRPVKLSVDKEDE